MARLGVSDGQRLWLLRHGLLLAALSTYLWDGEDVVWRVIRHSPRARSLEHLCFGAAAVALALALRLRFQRAQSASSRPDLRCPTAHLLTAAALGMLFPVAGLLILLAGEALLAIFLRRRVGLSAQDCEERASARTLAGPVAALLAMLVFSVTLSDRLAEWLFLGSGLISTVVFFSRGRTAAA